MSRRRSDPLGPNATEHEKEFYARFKLPWSLDNYHKTMAIDPGWHEARRAKQEASSGDESGRYVKGSGTSRIRPNRAAAGASEVSPAVYLMGRRSGPGEAPSSGLSGSQEVVLGSDIVVSNPDWDEHYGRKA